jgi:hypothetical protein
MCVAVKFDRRATTFPYPVMRKVALSALAATVGGRSVNGQAVGRCQLSDPSGYFTGTASSQVSGRLQISLNLRCADGRYDGALVTPLGTFAITGGYAASSELHVLFAVGADVGAIAAVVSSDTLRGNFTVSGDSGSLALRRLGEARAPGWDAPTLALTAAQWHEDLAFFAHEIAARHGNAFHSLARSGFDSLVTLLDRRLDGLNGDQVYVELDRIANLIGDGHTFVAPPDDVARFPFVVRHFGSEYRVIAVVRGNERILGAKLLSVQGEPVSVAIQRLWALTPADEHPSLRQVRAERFLSLGMLLHGLGLTPARDAVTLTLEDDTGQKFSFEARAVPSTATDSLSWRPVFASAPLYLQRSGDPFWCRYLPEARAIYCSFTGYDNFPNRAADLLAMVERLHPEKLVIDLRQNGGGDYTLGLRHLIEPISHLPLNQRGRLFVAIGANTFSAGMANAAQFRAQTAAILVGESIGEKPNSFQEPREMQLPHSHLIVRYSTRYYRFVDRGPNVVRPDHAVAPDWADYRAGRDPVLEWILDYDTASRSNSGTAK